MTSPLKLFKDWQLHPNKMMGQNFLKDPSTAETIIRRAGITSDEVVLEIGAGVGALTVPLAATAQKVYAVEADLRLIPLLQSETIKYGADRVVILEHNIMNVDFDDIAGHEKCKLVIIGNLPYNISSQILVKLIRQRDAIDRCVLMFQKELVDRITAPPGIKNYGRLAAMLAYCAVTKKIADIKAPLFFPQPKVDSEVIEIKFVAPGSPAKNETLLFKVVKAAFSKRRKMLKNAIGTSELGIDVKTAVTVLETSGIDPSRRAETLTVQEFVELSNSIYEVIF